LEEFFNPLVIRHLDLLLEHPSERSNPILPINNEDFIDMNLAIEVCYASLLIIEICDLWLIADNISSIYHALNKL